MIILLISLISFFVGLIVGAILSYLAYGNKGVENETKTNNNN